MARYEYIEKKDGLYKYKYYWQDPFLKDNEGNRKRRSKVEKFESKSDANDRFEYYAKLENDTTVKHTLNEVIDKWYKDYAIHKYSNIKDQDSTLKFIRPALGKMNIKDISTGDINKFLSDIKNSRRDNQSPKKLAKKTVSDSTVKNYYYTLKSIFNFATEYEYITINIMNSVKKVKVSSTSKLEKKTESDMIAYWNQVFECLKEEVDKAKGVYERRLTNYSKEVYLQKEQFKLIVLLTFETGLRASEVIALRYLDINPENNYLTVQYQLKNRELVATKMKENNEISRTLKISDRLANEINKHKKRNAYRKSKFLFTAPISGTNFQKFTTFSNGSVSQTWKRFLERNEVSLQRFHDIRHDYATFLFINLAENDVELRSEKVKDALGHSNADFTRRQYIHYSEDEKVSSDVNDATNKTFDKLNIDI